MSPWVLSGLFQVLSLLASATDGERPALGHGKWIEDNNLRHEYLKEDGQRIWVKGRMLLYLPAFADQQQPFPLVIVLHGWAQTPEDWKNKTRITALADKHRVVLAFPAMGSTVYESRFYEQTSKWNEMPGLAWVSQVVLPHVREKYNVVSDPGKTAIIGISTGGRGALRLCQQAPGFAFCASISGTYDLSLLQPNEGEYKIHARVFGSRDRFGQIWKDEDCTNPAYAEALKSSRLYLAHGSKDRAISTTQMLSMKKYLDGFHTRFEWKIVENGDHSWTFWDSQLPFVFAAMQEEFGK